MAKFFYKVKDNEYNLKQGVIDANSLADAALKLERKGYIVIEIKEDCSQVSNNYSRMDYSMDITLSIRDKKDFFNSFNSLYKSGCSILQIFDSIYNSSHNVKIKSLCLRILKTIKSGQSLKVALKNCSDSLGVAYTMLVVAGEESGQLAKVLANILENIKTQEKVKNDVISKMTYPVAMFFLAIFVALLFKTFIIKIFELRAAGTDFSITSLAISSGIQIGCVFLVIAGIIFVVYKNKNVLTNIISKLLFVPIIGNLIKNYSYLNFFSVLSLAYSAGVSIAEALYLSTSVIKLPNITDKLILAADRVQQGCELTTALSATSLFNDYAISQISTGEKSGELEKMLESVAYDYKSRLEVSLDVILKLLQPIAIVFVGLLALYVIIKAYSAYYNFLFSLM